MAVAGRLHRHASRAGPLLALVTTVGYSGGTFVTFATAGNAVTLCEALREAFDYFGGVPTPVQRRGNGHRAGQPASATSAPTPAATTAGRSAAPAARGAAGRRGRRRDR